MTPQPAPGAKLGPYEVIAPIGAGGMGEVFRGVDTRLNRPVAIKFSQEKFSDRFEREARAISSLNHPHICTLYDVGPNYLVMELVEGATLAAKLARGKLPVNEAMRYGGQLADALATAHGKGIVHRDLKPGNIMLTKSGVKVLDFGLAKSHGDETLTMANVAIGTPAYMSPEQREGRPTDARTDIYALGLILAEMASGKRSADELTGAFGHIVRRCLTTDPEDRWQSASDIKAELSFAASAPAQAAPSKSRTPSIPWAIAGLAFAGLMAALLHRPAEKPRTPVRFELTLDGQLGEFPPEVSPDGKFIAANLVDSSGKRLLWVRAIDEAEGRWIPGTDDASVPFWSPDSRWMGFHANGRMKKVSPTGGSPQTMFDSDGEFNAAWNGQGDIVFAPLNRSVLFRVRDSGGTPQAITKLDASRGENSHRWVRFLQDGRHFLFTARSTDAKNNTLYLGSLDSPETRRIMPIESQAIPIPGALLFVREGTLFRQSFDGEKVSGEPQAVGEKVLQNTISALADFSASADGNVFLFRPKGAGVKTLTWMKRDGTVAGVLGQTGDFYDPRISWDGTRVAFDRPDGDHGNRDIWIMDTRSGAATRKTSDPANELVPLWSADGTRIIFQSDRAGGPAMDAYEMRLDGTGSERKVDLRGPSGQFDVMDWSRDGKWLAVMRHVPPFDSIMVASATGDRPAFPFLNSRFSLLYPRFSPDGKWIAYQSDESGRMEVYVHSFADGPADSSPSIQITNNGGGIPESATSWSRDGSELLYLAPDFNLYSVQTRDLKSGTSPSSTLLFRTCPATQPYIEPLAGSTFTESPDGRFLVVCRAGQSSVTVTVGGMQEAPGSGAAIPGGMSSQ